MRKRDTYPIRFKVDIIDITNLEKNGGIFMSQNNFSLTPSSQQENLLTPAEVAILFRVDPKTVTRWAKAGKLTSIRTLGGHRRYKESEVKQLLKANTPNQSGGDYK